MEVVRRRRHFLDRPGHSLGIGFWYNRLGANAQGSEWSTKIMADCAESPVLLFEQIHDAAIHRVERIDRIAEVCGAARCHLHWLVPAAESLGGSGQIAERSGEAGRYEDRSRENEQ